MSTARRLKTFHITTFGCQMNLADSSTLVSSLLKRGYQRVEREQDADLFVLNTCSVRQKAEQRAIGRLWDLARHKKERPHVRIAVVGCMAQRLGADLARQVPHVDYVLGTDRLFELPDVIDKVEGASPLMTAFGHENIDVIEPVRETAYSAFVTISRGCDNFCSYCIVPFVRGRERAHHAEQIVGSVRRLVAEGVKEVMLLGQNVNSYHCDGVDFPELLDRVMARTAVARVRYMTSHPKDLSPRLVDVMASYSRIMPHIHLPLQSGSDRILKLMGREYSLEHFRSIVRMIRSKLAYVSLTTDLIVGFPSETEAEYEMTLQAASEIGFDAAFMFRYSVRPGTEAAKLNDNVPERDKIRRLSGLIALQQKIAHDRNQREVGQVRQSLVEGFSRRSTGLYRARTEGNKTVLFPGDRAFSPGEILPIRITSADAFTLHGELVEA